MELKFIERPKRNPITGRFLKGVAPHNKGKKWSDYMDGRKHNKVLKCLQRIGNPKLAGSNAIRIVGIKDGKLLSVFESSNHAYRKTKICARNIRSCCHKKRNHAGGVKWFFETDNEWIKIIEDAKNSNNKN